MLSGGSKDLVAHWVTEYLKNKDEIILIMTAATNDTAAICWCSSGIDKLKLDII